MFEVLKTEFKRAKSQGEEPQMKNKKSSFFGPSQTRPDLLHQTFHELLHIFTPSFDRSTSSSTKFSSFSLKPEPSSVSHG